VQLVKIEAAGLVVVKEGMRALCRTVAPHSLQVIEFVLMRIQMLVQGYGEDNVFGEVASRASWPVATVIEALKTTRFPSS
jgi:hypothetical protein